MSNPETATVIQANPDASHHLDSLLHDPAQPLVLFAVEWCEFCWAVRKLFKAIEVPYRAIELDSVKYQENNLGGRLRETLRERYAATTVPQVFVSGQHVGGATDTFEAWNSGRFQEWLQAAGVSFNVPPDLKPFELLPGWLHKL